MSGLVFCCCSAGRANKIADKTLRTLKDANFGGLLWLIVPHDEVVTYQQAVSGHPVLCMIIGAERGLVKQRKAFRASMLPGTEIVFIDDDVERIKCLVPDGRVRPITNIETLAHYVFECMSAVPDCLLAGVYPMINRDWQKLTTTRDNSYVVGALYFCINDERLVEPEQDELEDYARQLSEQAAGRPVLRFNWIGIQTKYFKNPGGMQNERNPETRRCAVESLANIYPTIVKPKVRKNGTPDLKFLAKPILTNLPHPVSHVTSSATSAHAT